MHRFYGFRADKLRLGSSYGAQAIELALEKQVKTSRRRSFIYFRWRWHKSALAQSVKPYQNSGPETSTQISLAIVECTIRLDR